MVEESMMPKGSDKQLVAKLAQHQAKQLFFSASYSALCLTLPTCCVIFNNVMVTFLLSLAYDQRKPDLFEVSHYAGKVAYNINGFLDKNKNTLTGDMIMCASSSGNPLLVRIFDEKGSFSCCYCVIVCGVLISFLAGAPPPSDDSANRVSKARVQKPGEAQKVDLCP